MIRSRRGATALTVAVSMGVLFGFVALVVDLGVARVGQAQLQAATDAGAIGGARRLDGTTSGMDLATATATEVSETNTVLGDAVVLDSGSGVTLGRWDPTTSSFVAETDPALVDAVQVIGQVDDVQTWFAMVLGKGSLATSTVSVATRGRALGAGRVPWYLPFALPDCVMDEHTGEELADITFVLSPAGEDSVGWGAVNGKPNASWVRDHIDSVLPCMHAWYETGEVIEECSQVAAGDTVGMGNGQQASSLHYLSDSMASGIPWDPERWGTLPARHSNSTVPTSAYGTVIEGPIPVFTGSSEYCTPKAPWNETYPVRGFVWGAIYDVAWKGGTTKENVWVRLDVSHIYEVGDWYGGDAWGITYDGPPVLVQ